MNLHETAPSFQEHIHGLATTYGKPAETIYGWWREYCRDCRNFDQSPILSEFERWHEARLKA